MTGDRTITNAGRAAMNGGLSAKLAWSEPDPESERIAGLVARLAEEDGPADDSLGWPHALWGLIDGAVRTRWSLPEEHGGVACPRPLLVERYAQLAEGSLTAVFILSQHDAGVRRLVASSDRAVAAIWLRAIGEGRAFTTVGISHLTTSRRLGAAGQGRRDRAGALPARRHDTVGDGRGTCPCSRDGSRSGRWPADALCAAGGSARSESRYAVSAGGAASVVHHRGRLERRDDRGIRPTGRTGARRHVQPGRRRDCGARDVGLGAGAGARRWRL